MLKMLPKQIIVTFTLQSVYGSQKSFRDNKLDFHRTKFGSSIFMHWNIIIKKIKFIQLFIINLASFSLFVTYHFVCKMIYIFSLALDTENSNALHCWANDIFTILHTERYILGCHKSQRRSRRLKNASTKCLQAGRDKVCNFKSIQDRAAYKCVHGTIKPSHTHTLTHTHTHSHTHTQTHAWASRAD